MAQRYICYQPCAGMNAYQIYSQAGMPTAQSPSQFSELGVPLGATYRGSFNTNWQFCQMLAASAAIAAGGTVNIDTSYNASTTTTGGTAGHSVIAVPAGAVGGVWFEISGATINTAPLDLPGRREAENDDDYAKRVHPWLVVNGYGDGPDYTPMTPAEHAAAMAQLEGAPTPHVQHPAAAAPPHPSAATMPRQ